MILTKQITLEQFLCLPETKPASEYVEGEVYRKEMPDEDHAAIQFWLALLFGEYLKGVPLGRGFIEYRCVFNQHGHRRTLVPDVLYVTNERLAEGRAARPTNARRKHLYAAPTIAIEILSVDQSARRFADKLHFYLTNGVDVVWVIDAQDKVISVYRPGQPTETLRAGDILREPVFLPGFTLDVSAMFAQLDD